MSPFLLTSTIPRLFLIHLNHEIIVWARLSSVEPVRYDVFFSNPTICRRVMTLSESIEISKKIWLTSAQRDRVQRTHVSVIVRAGAMGIMSDFAQAMVEVFTMVQIQGNARV